jgi:hypothetical protein
MSSLPGRNALSLSTINCALDSVEELTRKDMDAVLSYANMFRILIK